MTPDAEFFPCGHVSGLLADQMVLARVAPDGPNGLLAVAKHVTTDY
jgi:hypothetical protein